MSGALLAGLLSGCAAIRHELRHVTAGAEQQLADDVVIERDGWGVPHIEGRSEAAVAFGLAYAMAEDDYWQLEESLLRDLGWLSHYYGERYLAHDLVRAAFGVQAAARAAYAAETAERQRFWTAFAQGLNYYLHTHPDAPRRLIARYEPWMLLARAWDFDPGTRVGDTTLALLAGLAGTPPPAASPRQADASFALALGPSRTDGAHALLLAALDAPWFGSGQLYEAELRSADGWHAAGVAVLGTPALQAGQNAAGAWAHIPAAPGQLQLVPVLFDHPADSLAYREQGEWRRAAYIVDSISVNTAAGVVRRPFGFLRTHHGPVLRRRGDTAHVVQLPAGPERLRQWHAVSQATSPAEFQAALTRAPLAAWRTLVADTGGHLIDAHGGDARLDPPAGWLHAGAGGPVLLPLLERDSSWDAAALERLAFDTRAPAADADIPRLVDEWEQIGGSNPRRAFALDTAIELLRQWDRRFTADSRAAALYAAFRAELARAEYRAGAFGAFRALEAAAARQRRAAAGGFAAWGEVQRLQRRHTSGEEVFLDSLPSLALGAAPAGSGALFTAVTRQDLGWRSYGVSGRAWTAVTELSSPPRTRSVMVFGQSAHPASAHFQDQAARFVAGELKPLWFGAEAVREQVRERYHPGQRARVH